MTRYDNPYRAFGLHPLVAFGVVAVDFMLFGGEATTGGVSWVVSIAVAVALAIPVLLLQRFAYHDNWGAAAGKAALLAVLTAIPTPIPAIFPAAAGVLGMLKRPAALPAPNTEPAPQEPARPIAASHDPGTLDDELGRVLEKHGIARS